ncbi:MAG: acyltransferase [Verrucomicrobiota bacterium]|nr:acyltransferase [Verrucomicrobiota bacterium]
MRAIRAGAVQFNHHGGDKAFNLNRMQAFLEASRAQGVELLVFPEMCITGYWHVRRLDRASIEALSEPVPDGPSCRRLLDWARSTGITIGAGLIEAGEEDRLFNSYFVAMPDGRWACHRKLHCFISSHMSSGDEYTVFDSPFDCRIGVLICYDNNILENARITALKGADILLAPHQTGGCDSASPRAMGLIDPLLWERRHEEPEAIEAEFAGPKGMRWLKRWLPARAHDNGMFLVFSNGVGLDDGEVRTGNAMILDPYGEVLNETCSAEDWMVTAELDPCVLEMCTGRRWRRSRRPELYGPLTVPVGDEAPTREVRFQKQPLP